MDSNGVGIHESGLFGKGTKVFLIIIVLISVVVYFYLTFWVVPGISEPKITLLEGEIKNLTFFPLKPSLGVPVTFDAEYVGTNQYLKQVLDRRGFQFKIWWVPLSESHYSDYYSTGYGDEEWIARDDGAAIYMAYLKTEEQDKNLNCILSLSNTNVLALGNTNIVENSPLIKTSAEKLEISKKAPFARIVAEVKEENGSSILTRLRGAVVFWGVGLNPPPGQHHPWTATTHGSPWGYFEYNDTKKNGWLTYISESEPDFPGDPDGGDIPRGWAECLVVCWVSGLDSSNTIHFAEPLIYRVNFDE